MQCIKLNQKLSFDRIEPEIKLAKAYIEKCNGKFYAPNNTNENSEHKTVKDNYGNIIYITPEPLVKEKSVLFECGAKALNCFAKKLIENADLFAQLEFLIRGLPQQDIRKYDISLISDYFNYYGLMYTPDASYTTGEFHIYMRNETPLCTLGIVANQLFKDNKLVIHATRNTAVVCNLFVELIRESGFVKDLVTAFVEEDDIEVSTSYEGHFFFFNPLSTGSSAVVTEQTDMRAALSSLLEATTAPVYPWRLRKIYVQENVYEQFKSVLSEKALTQCDTRTNNEMFEQLKARSSAVFFYNDKSVVLDYVGGSDDHSLNLNLVLVEAYRTNKELLVLINAQSCNYLSLWCHDLSTANEIALAANVTSIWINEFGTFDGPTPIAPSFYGMHDFQKCNITYRKGNLNEKVVSEIQKMYQTIRNRQMNWKKLGVEKRRRIIIELLEKYYQSVDHVDGLWSIIYSFLKNYHSDSKIKIENNKVCLQLNQAINSLCILIGGCKAEIARDLIEFLLNGNAIIICDPKDYELLQFLAKHGVETGIPIGQLLFDGLSISDKAWIFSKLDVNLVDLTYGFGTTSIYKPKIICYQYGESFAN